MKHTWVIAGPDQELCRRLAEALNISPLFAQCLVNRGFSDSTAIDRFLNPRLKLLADPFLLPNMDKAVTRLLLARSLGEPLVVFGDYDVDGVTSVALLVQMLGKLGWNVSSYLPHRRDEGYGLSPDGVKNCLEKFPVHLMLAVDCGSNATATISWLRERGVDVVVLDHHQISDPAPDAVALVNPRVGAKVGVTAPFDELCSAGLSFKLAHALVKRLREENAPAAFQVDVRDCLDIVALGTIADLVPLTGENRILTSAGLERINANARPGLTALKQASQCAGVVGSHEVGFQLAPRLNAAGRLENAEGALRLLLAEDVATAEPIARALDAQNHERQTIEREIARQIVTTIRSRFDPETDFVIVEGNRHWHLGVVGIVASRVLGEFYRPAIVLGDGGGEWRGSGRSIEGFDLAAALRQCGDLLLRHGGHAMAAGLALAPENLDALRARLNALARVALKPEQLRRTLRLDAEVSLAEMTLERVEELARLNPTGQGNAPVRLAIRRLAHHQPPQRMGKENQHVKFRVTDGQKPLEAVWWNCGEAPLPKIRFDLAFTPQINDYNGRRSVQLKVLDWCEVSLA